MDKSLEEINSIVEWDLFREQQEKKTIGFVLEAIASLWDNLTSNQRDKIVKALCKEDRHRTIIYDHLSRKSDAMK